MKVYGEDFRETRRIAEEITRALGTVRGLLIWILIRNTLATVTDQYES